MTASALISAESVLIDFNKTYDDLTPVSEKGFVDMSLKAVESIPPLSDVLDDLTPPPFARALFAQYLNRTLCLENLDFILQLSAFQSITSAEERIFEWKIIYATFIQRDSPKELNLPSSFTNSMTAECEPDEQILKRAEAEIKNYVHDSYSHFTTEVTNSGNSLHESISPMDGMGIATPLTSGCSSSGLNAKCNTSYFPSLKSNPPSYDSSQQIPEIETNQNSLASNDSKSSLLDTPFAIDEDLKDLSISNPTKTSDSTSLQPTTRSSSIDFLVNSFKQGSSKSWTRKAAKKLKLGCESS